MAQGEPGVRALGLLREAMRALTGAGFARSAEVAAACVRSAADALLGLPRAPQAVGLKPAAQDLLATVDAFRTPGPCRPARRLPQSPTLDSRPPGGALRAPPNTDSDASQGPPATVGPAWERVAAAEVLRDELERPGGYHRGLARSIAERLTGITLGATQETALDVCRTGYGLASGILHGRAAGPDDAVTLSTELLCSAPELLVPLPGPRGPRPSNVPPFRTRARPRLANSPLGGPAG
ncbi:hypothetical protein ACFV4E_15700 [Streptomyces hygroscopicus]|uniref:Uncharacterized protein n=1 Tax=Streptomyces demainii TaxID=588122 RepID=A0ABT9L6T2_9ACTN|nr:hypothetical protein [Streptomyces demainii]MDP9616411.1 hypothetical protein [Streptomyces demainii]